MAYIPNLPGETRWTTIRPVKYPEQETVFRHRRYEAAADIYWHEYKENGVRAACDALLDHLTEEERHDPEFHHILHKRHR